MKDRRLICLLFACLAYFLGLTALGRYPNISGDEVYYKSAGREWAATGRFAAPELTGMYGLEPPPEEIWFVYPPLYPLLFGVFVKLFGFGWRQCVAFDGLIHVCLALLTYRVALRMSAEAGKRAAFWAGLAILPLGTAGRPDELATCFGMAGLLPLLSPRIGPGRERLIAAVSGALFGLCAGTSPPAASVLGLIALVALIARAEGAVQFLALGLTWAGAAAAVLAVLLTPILLAHPDALQQYLSVTRVVFRDDPRSHWQKVAALFVVNWRIGLLLLGILALGLTTVSRAYHRDALKRWATIWLGPLAGGAFLVVGDPHNYHYLWFLGPYLIAAAVVSLADPVLAPAPRSLGAYGFGGTLVVLTLLGAVDAVKQAMILATLPREQSMEYNARVLRQLLPRGSTLIAYEHWGSLGNDYLVYDPGVPPTHWAEVEYIVVGGKVLPPELWVYLKENFRPIHDNRSLGPPTLFGVPLSRTYLRGFGTSVFIRTPGPAARPAGLPPRPRRPLVASNRVGRQVA